MFREYKKFFVVSLVMCMVFYVYVKAEEGKIITDFKDLSAWTPGSAPYFQVASGEYGFEPAVGDKPARMWYLGTSNFRDIADCSYDPNYDVSEYDYIVVKYKVSKGTKITIDIYFDGKQVEPYPVAYKPGTGEWEEAKIPITGVILSRIGLSVTETTPDLGEGREYEAYFKEVILEKKEKKKKEEISLPEVIVIPTPKEMKLFSEELQLVASNKILFSILLSENPTETEKNTANELVEEIAKLSNIDKKQITILNEGETLPDNNIIFALGLYTNLSIFKEVSIKVPQEKESYTIKCVKYKNKDIICLSGIDNAGVYWSLQTLIQLIQKKEDKLVLPVCEVIDYPTYLIRAMGSGTHEQNVISVRYKINTLISYWWQRQCTTKWYEYYSEDYIKSLQDLVDFAVNRGLNVMQQEAPYWVDYRHSYCPDIKDDKALKPITCSNQEDIDKLFNIFKWSLERGNKIICLSLDDMANREWVKDFGIDCFQPEDIKFFNNDTAKGHAYLIAELCKRVRKYYPDAIVTVTPAHYSGFDDIKKYYDEDGVPKDVILLWPGKDTITFSFTEDEIKTYKENIDGRRFLLFDNTAGRSFGSNRDITICEPYAEGYNSMHKYSSGIQQMHRFLSRPNPQLANILALSMAEYMWNPETYKPEEARQKAIAKIAGKETVKPLLEFAYYYSQILNKYPVEKKPGELSAEEKERYKVTQERYEKLKPDIDSAGKSLEEIKKVCKNEKLIKELDLIYKQMVKLIEMLSGSGQKTKIYKPKEEISFLPENFFGGAGYTVYSYLCQPKKAVWIYGKKTLTHTLETEFELDSSPQSDAIIIIEGQDDDKEGKTMIEISLNNKPIFKRPNEFVEKGWSIKSIPIKREYMKSGKNVLTIANLEDTDSLSSKWFMINNAKIVFP